MPSLVSHEHKSLFIHVPRTGGTSLAYTLQDLFVPDGFETMEGQPNHLSFAEMLDQHGNRLWSYLKFMIVRNPWEQTASSLVWHRKHGDYMLSIEACCSKTLCPREIGLSQMDMVLRFDRLQADFDTLCDRLGINRRQLQHLNEGEQFNYREIHTEESKIIVQRRFWKTIERFGYAF